jgi:glucose/arabinose dehydrogenase
MALLLVLGAGPVVAGQNGPIIIQGDVAIERGFARETVVSGLHHPWGMVFLPNGDVLVTERRGDLRLVRMQDDGTGVLDPKPVSGVPDVFASGQGGLLDIMLHPDFAGNKLVYFSYSYGDRNVNRTRVARAKYADGRVSDWEVVFEVNRGKNGTQHFGSRLCWLPDGTLLISVGDGGNPPIKLDGENIRDQAQNLANQLGSLVRINDDGSIPEDNPFKGKKGASPDIFSYGHRNVQGLAYDPIRGMIWVSEHGALGGDELNRPEAGKNYGWPSVTYSREYFDGSKIAPDVSKPGMVDPLLIWLSAIAPSGLTLYTGDMFPDWKGDLFAGALIKQSVRRIKLDPAGGIAGQWELRFGARVRDVRQGPDGLLYVITDEEDGRLIRVTPVEGGDYAP